MNAASKVIRTWRSRKGRRKWQNDGVLFANLYFEREEMLHEQSQA